MKAFPLMVIVISISLICALNFSLVSALGSDEASVSLLWLSPAVTNGDIVAVRMTFTSNSPDLLRIFRIGFHFDWMATNEYYTSDFSSNPVSIPSSGSQVFDDLSIEIPFNVTVGDHSYFVAVEGTEGLTQETFSWESPVFTIKIQPLAARFYKELGSEVETKLSNASAANYKNSEAQSLLQQAQTQYEAAKAFALQEEWNNALISLENATSSLDQAKLAEERGADQSLELQNLLFYLAIIAVVVIVVVLIIVVVRTRRKQPAGVVDQPVDQSFDEQMETQDYTP
jgi:predicted lactoylglutathione lyase